MPSIECIIQIYLTADFNVLEVKMESIRKVRNINFQWTKT